MDYKFNFECKRCGICCKEEGYVFFSSREIDTAAAHLKISRREFIKDYLITTMSGYAHEVESGGQCSFLTKKGCIINDVKPAQCGSFPFWKEYIGAHGELINFDRPCKGIKKN